MEGAEEIDVARREARRRRNPASRALKAKSRLPRRTEIRECETRWVTLVNAV